MRSCKKIAIILYEYALKANKTYFTSLFHYWLLPHTVQCNKDDTCFLRAVNTSKNYITKIKLQTHKKEYIHQ